MRSHREGIEDEYHWSCPCGFGTDDETAWMYHECPPEEEEEHGSDARSRPAMSDHVITVTAYAGPRLGARCSCGGYVLWSLTRIGATLDELNRLTDEHITAAEIPTNPPTSPRSG